MIVGEECRGQSGESRERWGGGVCTAVLKQGELQSGNNGSKVMADFCESYGELCSDMCAQASILCMYIISLYV